MPDLATELRDTAADLRAVHLKGEQPSVSSTLEALEEAAATAARAWSGSSLGYHSCVYYSDLRPPPPGAHFSQEWGLKGTFQGSTGDWHEYPYADMYAHILALAGDPDLEPADQLAAEATRAANDARSAIDSILTAWLSDRDDGFISQQKTRVDEVVILTATRAAELQVGDGAVMTRDTTALGQGRRAAPHQAILGRVVGCRSPLSACLELADLADQAAAHLDRTDRRHLRASASTPGSFVFIGHGRSAQWRELKDFIEDRLGLHGDEFNRVPVAGVTNVERLVQMLDDAGIALLVLTAEDETVDGESLARQNVVHEAGLFQGRLGFSRAIVLLEEGCAEFSNIAGLGQIRYPAGNISASFEEVRRVLEREGLV